MRTYLRGKITLLFMMLGMLLAVPTVALAADLLTEAELSSDVSARTEVAPNDTTNFDIKVWARGNINNASATGNATIVNAYTMGSGGTITPNSSSTTIVKFKTNHNYGADGQTCPAAADVPTQPAGVTGRGCATDPFIVPATITVGNLAGGTNGTLTVEATGSTALGATSTPTCSTSDNAIIAPNNVADTTDCTKDQGFVTVASSNSDPVINVAADNANGNEGNTLNTDGLFSDPDGDPLTVAKQSGDGTVTPTNTNGAWEWSLATTDQTSGTVVVRATDPDGAFVEDTFTYSAANVAPTATKSFDSSANEGSSFNLALTDPSDPSSADTTAGFTYAFDCGSGYGAFGSSDTASCPTTDNGTRSVGAKIKDKDDGVTEYTGTVTVNNVPPTITNITASAQNVLADKNVTFTGTATDPSSVDTTAGFFWQWAVDGGALGTFGTQGNSQFTHSFSDSDCGSHSVSAKAKDKDDGLSALFTKSNVVNVYSASYNSPLNEGMYNMVQAGRVVPVKISVGCASSLTGLQPSIQLLKGEQDGGESTSGTDNVETLSSSAADTTGIMRAVDGGYIYNLQVPSTAKANELYTVRVNPFGGSNASSNMYVVLKIRK